MSEYKNVNDFFLEPTEAVEEVEEVKDAEITVEEEPEIVESLEETTEDVVEDVIVLEKPEKVGKGLGSVAGGAIGSTVVKNKPKADKPKPVAKKEETTVAIHSTRNVTWEGVGKVYNGYNIVTKEQADQWLTRTHVRLATPDEVAKEFGL